VPRRGHTMNGSPARTGLSRQQESRFYQPAQDWSCRSLGKTRCTLKFVRSRQPIVNQGKNEKVEISSVPFVRKCGHEQEYTQCKTENTTEETVSLLLADHVVSFFALDCCRYLVGDLKAGLFASCFARSGTSRTAVC
jgi:hypothetical protein